MKEKIHDLKLLNAAYIAALEYDYCPSEEEVENVMGLYNLGVTKESASEAFSNNQGRRPDEIASTMSDLIKSL